MSKESDDLLSRRAGSAGSRMMTRLLSRIKAFLDRLDYLLAEGVDHQENVWRKRK